MNYQELLRSPLIPSAIVTLIEKASHNNAPVLIQGEDGTGKELVAKIIHYTGEWKSHRFYKIDCKFLTEDSFSDQLLRLLKEVNYGTIPCTLYLKEVGFLKQASQVKLLELIEDPLFQNGVERKLIQNLRCISSSSEELKAKVTQGNFSQDLYDRLNTLSITIPSLRERAKEIPIIAQYILAEHSQKMKIKKVGISKHANALLESYWWPGNLTEFEHVIIRSAILSEGESLMEQDLFFEIENEKNSFPSFLRKAGMKPSTSEGKNPSNEQNAPSLPLFFIELVHRIKNPLVSIKTFTQLLREKFDDAEFRDYFYRIVTEDIEKIDSVLNGLLNFIKINTPINKTNTIHSILEEILKKLETQFEQRKIKIFRQFEKDLPETIVHDEQLRYILDALLQYAMPSIPPEGSIGLLTKSLNLEEQMGGDRTSRQKDGRYIEIVIIFTGFKKSIEKVETTLGISPLQREETIELELRLVKEIIQKNRGVMKFEVNEKKPRTLISLKFPVERRKVVYYPSTNA